MSKNSLGLLVAAVVFLCTMVMVHPVSGQRNGGVADLPAGTGQDVVAQQCTKCHGTNMITGSWGYTQQGWKDLFGSMVMLPNDQATTIASYLGTHFPEKARPKSVVIPGDVKVNIREWVAPTLGSRPHDPLAAADGTIWWAGMWGNVLGHLDPKTGALKEYPLKTPKSGPHGLTQDKAGNIWFTANTGGYVGKFDPKTEVITEYKMPDPAARDPHTPLFDRKGQLWFTLQGANMVGRLNPQTGEVKLVNLPQPRSNPYGMVMMSNGNPLICEFGANRLAGFDIDTMAITEYTLPDPMTRPRRIAIDSADNIWYGDYSRGFLGRFNPKTRETKEWPSPSGPQSQPYGISVIKDIVWYNESAIRPNTLVRFDPKAEKFQSWIIPAGGGVVRNMSVLPNGNLAMAESGVNRVALVEITNPPARGTR
jgi:virginiamycin B lyase